MYYYQQGQPAYAYSNPAPAARNTQPLTQEQISKLRSDNDALNLKISQEDMWKAVCTHKEKNGSSALINNEDGSVTCTICHERFRLQEFSPADVENHINTMLDICQTIKTIYVDAPDDLIKQFMQIIPLLKLIKNLWTIACNNFSKYDSYSGGVNPINNMYGGFATVNNLLTNPYAAYQPQAQYPVYGQQPPVQNQMPDWNGNVPVYPNQPQPQIMYTGYPQQPPMQNPMAVGAPVQQAPAVGVIPGQNVPVYPNQPQAAQQSQPVVEQQAPVAANNGGTAEVQQVQTYSV